MKTFLKVDLLAMLYLESVYSALMNCSNILIDLCCCHDQTGYALHTQQIQRHVKDYSAQYPSILSANTNPALNGNEFIFAFCCV